MIAVDKCVADMCHTGTTSSDTVATLIFRPACKDLEVPVGAQLTVLGDLPTELSFEIPQERNGAGRL